MASEAEPYTHVAKKNFSLWTQRLSCRTRPNKSFPYSTNNTKVSNSVCYFNWVCCVLTGGLLHPCLHSDILDTKDDRHRIHKLVSRWRISVTWWLEILLFVVISEVSKPLGNAYNNLVPKFRFDTCPCYTVYPYTIFFAFMAVLFIFRIIIRSQDYQKQRIRNGRSTNSREHMKHRYSLMTLS